jgi:beta-lactam-binding protein with PASTA domain
LVAAVALGVAMVLLLPSGGRKTSVPELEGESRAVAVKRLARHELKPNIIVSERAARRLPRRLAGRIVQQSWWAGARLPVGSVVTLSLYPRGDR